MFLHVAAQNHTWIPTSTHTHTEVCVSLYWRSGDVSGLCYDCVAGVGLLLCAMCLSILLLCLWTLFLQVSLHTRALARTFRGWLYRYLYVCDVEVTRWVCLCVWHRAVCKKFGLHVGRLMLAFLVLSTGMFSSSAGWSNLFTKFIHLGLCRCSS